MHSKMMLHKIYLAAAAYCWVGCGLNTSNFAGKYDARAMYIPSKEGLNCCHASSTTT